MWNPKTRWRGGGKNGGRTFLSANPIGLGSARCAIGFGGLESPPAAAAERLIRSTAVVIAPAPRVESGDTMAWRRKRRRADIPVRQPDWSGDAFWVNRVPPDRKPRPPSSPFKNSGFVLWAGRRDLLRRSSVPYCNEYASSSLLESRAAALQFPWRPVLERAASSRSLETTGSGVRWWLPLGLESCPSVRQNPTGRCVLCRS